MLTNQTRTVLYIGVTNNLERRLCEHSGGLGDAGKFTGLYQCNLLVYFETVPGATQTIGREKQIKKWSRAKKESLVNALNPTWEPIDLHAWAG
ncbi:MAG: GIY-YIG nuclease family protein [Janthinobacterium lividum]